MLLASLDLFWIYSVLFSVVFSVLSDVTMRQFVGIRVNSTFYPLILNCGTAYHMEIISIV